MKADDLDKTYWVWMWGLENDIKGIELFNDHTEMKNYSAQHSKEYSNDHYWSTYDKIEKN